MTQLTLIQMGSVYLRYQLRNGSNYYLTTAFSDGLVVNIEYLTSNS